MWDACQILKALNKKKIAKMVTVKKWSEKEPLNRLPGYHMSRPILNAPHCVFGKSDGIILCTCS